LKKKVDELSEQKVRISLIEKKSETQTKELEEKNRMLSQSITDLKEEISKKEKLEFKFKIVANELLEVIKCYL
jgi:hypothetical protein